MRAPTRRGTVRGIFGAAALLLGAASGPAEALDISPLGASYSLPVTNRNGSIGSYDITLEPFAGDADTLLLSVKSTDGAYSPDLTFVWSGPDGSIDAHALKQTSTGLSSLLISNFGDSETAFKLGTPSAATHYFTARISYDQLPSSFEVLASNSTSTLGSSVDEALEEFITSNDLPVEVSVTNEETPVPEPTAALVFAAGLLAVGRAVRRSRPAQR